MKKLFLLFCLMAGCSLAVSQDRYKTSEGTIRFNASTPLEDIDATNSRVNAILKSDTGDFGSVLLIRDFEFRRKLMQEHFNENYMESGTYPKAYFRGRLLGYDYNTITTEPQPMKIAGELTIHGVSRTLETAALIKKAGDNIIITTEFIVEPETYNIEVPKILFNKIAEEVKVYVTFKLRKDSNPSG